MLAPLNPTPFLSKPKVRNHLLHTMAKTQKDNEIIEIARGLTGTPWCEEYEKMISGML